MAIPLVFLHQQQLTGDIPLGPFHLKCALKVTQPLAGTSDFNKFHQL